MLIEAGNFVYGCILIYKSVAYHFWVSVTLTLTSFFRLKVSVAYLLYYIIL